jgi:hypothetical protein
MTKYDYDKPGAEPEITITNAVPDAPQQQGPPIPAGHSRFYCEKCHTVSVLLFGWSATGIACVVKLWVLSKGSHSDCFFSCLIQFFLCSFPVV